MKIRVAPFKFKNFSKKQKQILTWWMEGSPANDRDIIIADGSVRSGKTISMSLSYVIWSMDSFTDENFGMAGKTIGSFRRNVLIPLKRMLGALKYIVKEHRSENMIEISYKGKTNYYYLFGGKDESSQDLIQGITLAGMLFDEVVLMPQSFVNQATARCSVEGARMWFNCNPEGPSHWFKLEYIDNVEEKNALYLHFVMDDNLSLSEKVKNRYKCQYRGVFYERYILGLWAIAQGAVYGDAWSDDLLFDEDELEPGIRNNKKYKRYILVDFGIVNPTAFLDVIDDGVYWWIVNEWYYGTKDEERQMTVQKIADELEKFIGSYELRPKYIVIDPSAAVFKVELRARCLRIKEVDEELVNANNRVLEGIQKVNSALAKKMIRIHKNCKNLHRELLSYVWDSEAIAKGQAEKPIKLNDHTVDCLRYGIHTLISDRRILAHE